MAFIRKTPIPENGLLGAYARRAGNYVDCYSVDIAGRIELNSYVENFFGTRLMMLERRLIGRPGSGKPDSEEVRSLLNGDSDRLAWWRVEGREPGQLLLSVPQMGTRTWFMVRKTRHGTRLYFGSAVLNPGLVSRVLVPFHTIYSRLLLRSASNACGRLPR